MRKSQDSHSIILQLNLKAQILNEGSYYWQYCQRFVCVMLIATFCFLIDLEQELADYNGDDENEGEFEADKQAELAQI